MQAHKLIGAPVSLYTGKARAYLRFKQIPFDEVLATREVYQQLIVPRTGVRYIPVLVSDRDEVVQDTTEIIDFLEARYPQPSIYPDAPLQRLIALLFEVYGDEWLVIPAMHYRWSFEENRSFAIGEFGRTSAPDLSPAEQAALGARLSGPFAGALPYLGVSETTSAAIEHSYLGFLRDFDRHLRDHAFLLGSRPSIGDYGLIGPLYAHLYRDPYSGRLMQQQAPRVAQWVERMHQPPQDAGPGAFLDDDAVPQTLLPMLQRMFEEQVPVLHATVEAVAAWAQQGQGEGRSDGQSERELPRALGKAIFHIGQSEGQRALMPYHLWMWQRPHDQFASLSEAQRTRVASLLGNSALDALSKPIPARVRRIDNRLHLAS